MLPKEPIGLISQDQRPYSPERPTTIITMLGTEGTILSSRSPLGSFLYARISNTIRNSSGDRDYGLFSVTGFLSLGRFPRIQIL